MEEFHVFTFLNLDALKRVMLQLNSSEFTKKSIEGRVTVIKSWNSTKLNKFPRNEYSFEDLLRLQARKNRPTITTKDHEFYYHSELLTIVLALDINADVFGNVVVKLR